MFESTTQHLRRWCGRNLKTQKNNIFRCRTGTPPSILHPLTMFDFCFHPWNSRTTFIPPCFDIHKEIWNLRNAKNIMYSHCKYVLMRLQADSKGSGFKHANSGYWQWSKKFTLLLYWKVLFIGNSSSDMKENFKVVRHEKEFRIRIASLSSSK